MVDTNILLADTNIPFADTDISVHPYYTNKVQMKWDDYKNIKYLQYKFERQMLVVDIAIPRSHMVTLLYYLPLWLCVLPKSVKDNCR